MTIKEFYALNCLLDHSERDIQYGEDGSYNKDGEYDLKEVALSSLAQKYIMRLLAKKQHQMAARKINKAFASGKLRIEI